MLPDIDGFTVTRRIRQEGIGAPVLFLTARDDTQDKVMGLTVGGDDYVTKPFSLEEVVARIRAILRRTREQVEDDPIIRVGDLEINEDSHDVSRAGHAIDLSPTEYKLLRYLMDNEGRVLSKAQILDHVWQYDWGGDAAIVESYISYLRKKVDGIMVTDDNGEQHKVTPLIETKRGIGYMIREPRVSAWVTEPPQARPRHREPCRPARPGPREPRRYLRRQPPLRARSVRPIPRVCGRH